LLENLPFLVSIESISRNNLKKPTLYFVFLQLILSSSKFKFIQAISEKMISQHSQIIKKGILPLIPLLFNLLLHYTIA